MSETVIKVENLSKRYRLGELHKQTNSFREKVTNSFRHVFNSFRSAPGSMPSAPGSMPSSHSTKSKAKNPTPHGAMSSSSDDAIWALCDVSFEVKRGEIVGIIGRNGAGKTTLLKILSRITKPTEGKAWINGRVGSLLEVGTGFHPELTGRENIFLNGAILGMTKIDIRRKFDEIVDFAEIEKFIDTPVKRYSSGMYVRLAFAVAAHLEPEILMVDEVLAVGDAAFQKKCLGKMGDVAKEGRTVLFVSHNMHAIQYLCQTALLLDCGKIVRKDSASEIIRKYSEIGLHTSSREIDCRDIRRSNGLGAKAKITRVCLHTHLDNAVIFYRDRLKVDIDVECTKNVPGLVFGLGVNFTDGTRAFTCDSDDVMNPIDALAGSQLTATMTLPHPCLTPGRYLLLLGLNSGFQNLIDFLPNTIQFEVLAVDSLGKAVPERIGTSRVWAEWDVKGHDSSQFDQKR